ncbi:little elongation complex subunit 2 isoform X2 [Dunckerocampus dactyliophorus]|uniref:little elongation complex subunit 2 isoform X2 n=1 Tax=Dunckerocampus dactyliophorus TaxID=161453 RepID=UPI002407375D|nr:little elongation complex subunit 2 isoform X2 [Dunckerocampus dactyliophorus]
MELFWEDPPVSEAPFFTRELYDRFSLAPSIRDLWASLQSPAEDANIKRKCDALTGQNSTTKEDAEFKNSTCISKDDSCWDSMDIDSSFTDYAVEAAEGCKETTKANVLPKQKKTEGDDAYPQPRLPFPCMSSLSSKEQRIYLGFLMNKKRNDPPMYLKARMDHEMMQFQRYLQDVSKVCADDYSFISQGALQYAEEFLRASLECIKMFPQLYQICEMTSLTGGRFNPGLSLTFEKQLVVMGSVDITGPMIVPADAQLATDYQSVSSENPPAKKAKDMHAAISSDENAEKLCARYEPHVCITRDALVTLLDNHGPDFAQGWELPVCIKVNHGKGVTQKTVYLESPLIKNEITVREKSHVFHEESLKRSILKNGNRNVFHLMMEIPVDDPKPSQESSQRNMVSHNSNELNFDVDMTDLETFGCEPLTKTHKEQKTHSMQISCVKSASPPLSSKLSEPLSHSSQEEMHHSLTVLNRFLATEETTLMVATEANEVTSAKPEGESDKDSAEDLAVTGDSDDEKLVIDDSSSQTATVKIQCTPESTSDPVVTPSAESVPLASSSPKKNAVHRQQSKSTKLPTDQLGEILRMQTAMFSSANNAPKCPSTSQETVSSTQCAASSRHSLQLSLVKPCVTSYLERNQEHSEETPMTTAVVHTSTTQQKKILPWELQASSEDERDYTAPEKGNLLYKLYTLQDLLIMVRTSVSLARPTKVVVNASQFVPVHVLPKLDYQLCHGVECLSSSEACQLWTETALHSSTTSYIAHINPHTSKVALLRRLPDTWIHNISCGFKPVKSLNIAHHLLKKLTKMEEGQYLITHKPGEPFVTLLKAADGKACRGAYNLQQVHSDLPQAPASGLVPWIPLDPTVWMPFHKKHGRVPCTFPPALSPQHAAIHRASRPNNSANGPSQSGGGKKKKKKKKKKNNCAAK